MSMGHFAVDGFVIGYSQLKKLCPAEIKAIETSPHWDLVGWGVLAKAKDWQSDEEITDALLDREWINEKQAEKLTKHYSKLVAKLYAAFKKKTKLGLMLNHYNTDEGGLYDQVPQHDGCIFLVSGMINYTPAGKKYKKIVTKARWLQFG